jgi:hypothetical protein
VEGKTLDGELIICNATLVFAPLRNSGQHVPRSIQELVKSWLGKVARFSYTCGGSRWIQKQLGIRVWLVWGYLGAG